MTNQDENATPKVLEFYPNIRSTPGLWYTDEHGRTRLWHGCDVIARDLDSRIDDWIEDWVERGIRTQWIEQGHRLLAELRTIVEPLGHTIVAKFETPQPGQRRGPDHEPTVLNFYPDTAAEPALWFDLPGGGDCLWLTDAVPDELDDEIAAWIEGWELGSSRRPPYPPEWIAEGYRLAEELQQRLAPLGHTVNATFETARADTSSADG